MKILRMIKKIRLALRWVSNAFPLKSDFGSCGSHCIIKYPIVGPKNNVFLEDHCKIRYGANFIMGSSERLFIKKYTVLAPNCTIITNSHVSTVTIPHILLGLSHVNDKSGDVIINEDVWIGANVTILAGVSIGRGAIVAAGSVVSRPIPPYALVAGAPAKILKRKFTIEQILKHESVLYPESERKSRQQLEEEEQLYFSDKKNFGLESGIDENARETLNNLCSKLEINIEY